MKQWQVQKNNHRLSSGEAVHSRKWERALEEGGFLWGIVDGGLRGKWVRGSYVGNCGRGSTLG